MQSKCNAMQFDKILFSVNEFVWWRLQHFAFDFTFFTFLSLFIIFYLTVNLFSFLCIYGSNKSVRTAGWFWSVGRIILWSSMLPRLPSGAGWFSGSLAQCLDSPAQPSPPHPTPPQPTPPQPPLTCLTLRLGQQVVGLQDQKWSVSIAVNLSSALAILDTYVVWFVKQPKKVRSIVL